MAGEANALMEAYEMRLGVGMDAIAAGFETGAQRRDRRPLAVGARDMNRGRQPGLRVTERGEQALDAAQGQVDLFRVQRHQALQHPITLMNGAAEQWAYSAAFESGGAGNAASPRTGSRSKDRMRAKAACNSPRGTT